MADTLPIFIFVVLCAALCYVALTPDYKPSPPIRIGDAVVHDGDLDIWTVVEIEDNEAICWRYEDAPTSLESGIVRRDRKLIERKFPVSVLRHVKREAFV